MNNYKFLSENLNDLVYGEPLKHYNLNINTYYKLDFTFFIKMIEL